MSDSVLEHFYRRHYPTESRKQMVLVVDDDAMLRELLARVLVEEGFAVLTAEDGEQALAIASTLDGQLGLVVTDIRMPGLTASNSRATSPASSLHLPYYSSLALPTTAISAVPCSLRDSGRLPSSSRLVMLPSIEHH
jgi:ActR/RegA family two-component response regulator